MKNYCYLLVLFGFQLNEFLIWFVVVKQIINNYCLIITKWPILYNTGGTMEQQHSCTKFGMEWLEYRAIGIWNDWKWDNWKMERVENGTVIDRKYWGMGHKRELVPPGRKTLEWNGIELNRMRQNKNMKKLTVNYYLKFKVTNLSKSVQLLYQASIFQSQNSRLNQINLCLIFNRINFQFHLVFL